MARHKKCRICKKESFIYLRYANLPLCKEHFVERTESAVRRTIIKYRMFSQKDKILVAVSGGKDSLALWHIIGKLGYRADGIHIDLGIGDFSAESRKITERFAKEHGFRLNVVSIIEELGTTINEAVKGSHESPCSLCGSIKRYILNKWSYENGYSVLVTGHNLDDESARLLGNILTWNEDYLHRQFPVLPTEGKMIKKVKPLVFLTKEEILSYCEAEGIEYVKVRCPNSKGARSLFLADIMDKIEEEYPTTKLRFVRGFYDNIRKRFPRSSSLKFYECPKCGMLTASEKGCRFCRLKERFSKQKQPSVSQ